MIRRNRFDDENIVLTKKTIPVKPLTIYQFVGMIETVPGFSFARISDGGFFCIMGRKGVNCDGAAYSKAQADALISMMKDRTITHGITSIALHVTKAAEWLDEHRLYVDWYDADVMNKASDEGNLLPFIECLKRRRSIVVGPSHLDNLSGFGIADFIECHPTEAFEEVDALESEIIYQIARHEPDTILLSAGQGASPTLVSKIHASNPDLVVIDTGSLWDPYVGVLSRSGHKRRGHDWYKKMIKINFGEDVDKWVKLW